MSVDTYKGESPGKKLARLTYWESIRHERAAAFKSARFFVLGSREGGDVACLLGLGVPISRIVACDSNRFAADMLQAKFPDLKIVRDDCFEYLRGRVTSFDEVLLDFCSQPLSHLLSKMADMSTRMKHGAGLGYCFIRGREQESEVKAMQLRSKAAVTGTVDAGRCALVAHALAATALKARRRLSTLTHLEYHSRSQTSRGVPMFMGRLRVNLEPYEPTVRRINAVGWGGDVDETSVRKVALTLPADAAGLLLNISRGTIAAWRAHETRGTYDGAR